MAREDLRSMRAWTKGPRNRRLVAKVPQRQHHRTSTIGRKSPRRLKTMRSNPTRSNPKPMHRPGRGTLFYRRSCLLINGAARKVAFLRPTSRWPQ